MGAVRLFLALVVCLNHWQAVMLGPRDITIPGRLLLGFNAGYAVLFFYVISGFLITFTLSRNYEPTAGGTGKFYFNRFIRIFSVYWPLVALAFIAVPPARNQFLDASIVDKFTALFLFGSDWRVSFGAPGGQYFGGNIVGMNQAWTLGAELTFYVFAPFLLRSWKVAAGLLVASFAIRAGFVIAYGQNIHDLWTYTFFPSTFVFFLMGHLAFRAAQGWLLLQSERLGYWCVGLSFAFMLIWHQGGFDTVRLWVSIVLFAIGLPAFFEATKSNVWLNRLGELSYPVYLVQIFVLFFVGGDIMALAFGPAISSPLLSTGLSVAAYVTATLAAAAIVHYLVETPIAAVVYSLSRKHPNRPG